LVAGLGSLIMSFSIAIAFRGGVVAALRTPGSVVLGIPVSAAAARRRLWLLRSSVTAIVCSLPTRGT